MSHPRDRAIGAQLRAIRRTQTDLSLEAAAELLQWSPATFSRIETGKRHVTSEEIMAILVAYNVPVAQRDEMVAKSKSSDQPGWWDAPLPGVPQDFGTLASYEADADRLTDWSPMMVPGLLQTQGYARGYMLHAGAAPQDVEMRWMARFQRQQALRRVNYTGYIGEAALHTQFGTEEDFTDQLRHLYAMVGAVNTSIRVVPEHTPHSALLHSFLLIEFPEAEAVTYIELVKGRGVYLSQAEVDYYLRIRDDLDRIALSSRESRDRLRVIVRNREG